jgi:hypothetical protein
MNTSAVQRGCEAGVTVVAVVRYVAPRTGFAKPPSQATMSTEIIGCNGKSRVEGERK